MAVSKGKIQHVAPRPGEWKPDYRTSLVAGAAAFYDLPLPKPPERTVMIRADAALRVVHPYSEAFGEPIRVFHDVERRAATRLAVFNLLDRRADIAVRSQHGREVRCDTALIVTHRVNRRGDTAQRVGNRLGASADLKQTVFIVLINESHVIAT